MSGQLDMNANVCGALVVFSISVNIVFFCGKDCTLEPDKKNPNRWKKAFLCRTADEKGHKISREEILKHCKERGDSLGARCELSSVFSSGRFARSRCQIPQGLLFAFLY
jgi:hypothetical protein